MALGAAGVGLPVGVLAGSARHALVGQAGESEGALSVEDVRAALRVVGLEFASDDLAGVLREVTGYRRMWPGLRESSDDAELAMGSVWSLATVVPPGAAGVVRVKTGVGDVERPARDEDLAGMSVVELSTLLAAGKVTSVELTDLFLRRLREYGPRLRCVVTLTEERARREAERADQMRAERVQVSPLCGVPYGAKDLFEAEGYPTTWGVEWRKGAISARDSDVVAQLADAGAVLVAKLSLGALAMGDRWYAGRTESPWDEQIGSSGSSAGSAAAVAARLVPFAIGTETNGSIVSPSHNCRVTGLRPTVGSISKAGAMALCWTLDKVGPICRDGEDCALVFGELLGVSGRDAGQVWRGFEYGGAADLSGVELGYLVGRVEDAEKPVDAGSRPYLRQLADLGATFRGVWLPDAPEGTYSVLFAESSAAFESLVRGERVEELEKYSAWPTYFRAGRLIPAVEYIQADRVRSRLAREYAQALGAFRAVVADDRLYPRIYPLNLTGFPQVLVPWGVDGQGRAVSFSLTGPAWGEGGLLEVAQAAQLAGGFHGSAPPGFGL